MYFIGMAYQEVSGVADACEELKYSQKHGTIHSIWFCE